MTHLVSSQVRQMWRRIASAHASSSSAEAARIRWYGLRGEEGVCSSISKTCWDDGGDGGDDGDGGDACVIRRESGFSLILAAEVEACAADAEVEAADAEVDAEVEAAALTSRSHCSRWGSNQRLTSQRLTNQRLTNQRLMNQRLTNQRLTRREAKGEEGRMAPAPSRPWGPPTYLYACTCVHMRMRICVCVHTYGAGPALEAPACVPPHTQLSWADCSQ